MRAPQTESFDQDTLLESIESTVRRRRRHEGRPIDFWDTVTNCSTVGTEDTVGDLAWALQGGGDITFACNGSIVIPAIVISAENVALVSRAMMIVSSPTPGFEETLPPHCEILQQMLGEVPVDTPEYEFLALELLEDCVRAVPLAEATEAADPTTAVTTSAPGVSTIDLGTLGGAYSQGTAINDLGQVTGRAVTAEGWTHACRWAIDLPASSPQEQIDKIILEVDALADVGVLNAGQATSLTARLDTAKRQLDMENTQAACNVLSALANHTQALVTAGVLFGAEGGLLIDAAQDLIDALCG